ncbi:unnamed protein product [Mesocestoides corti]|uniref:EGF-like domain-containing protein n=1 Tax=Mesocestoides corti TaxID=53468 RepID=A0A0R3UAM9_MESCO|nr:unnamed protein product [Mesocestoides corti]
MLRTVVVFVLACHLVPTLACYGFGCNGDYKFTNCKTNVCHYGPYTGYDCQNGLCLRVCVGGSCFNPVFPNVGYMDGGFPGGQGYGMPNYGYPDYGMSGYDNSFYPGPEQYSSDFGYNPYGYGQNQAAGGYGRVASSNRQGRENCADGKCGSYKSGASESSTSKSSN